MHGLFQETADTVDFRLSFALGNAVLNSVQCVAICVVL